MHLEKFHYKYLGASALFFAFMFMSILFFAYVIFTPSTSSQIEIIEQALPESIEDDSGTEISNSSEINNSTAIEQGALLAKFPWCYESAAIAPLQLEMLAKIPSVNALPITKTNSDTYLISFPNDNVSAQFFDSKKDVNLNKENNTWVLNKGLSHDMAQKVLETYPQNIRKKATLIAQKKTTTLFTMKYELLNQKSFEQSSAFLQKYSGVSSISIGCDSFKQFNKQNKQ